MSLICVTIHYYKLHMYSDNSLIHGTIKYESRYELRKMWWRVVR